jgi:hypothetical protein
MEINRLLVILDDWAKWMKFDNHRLGYPSKSSFLTSGGESSHDAFKHMIEEADKENVKTMNAIINSLEPEQRKAVYARYLKEKKPMYYEVKLNLAMDNMLTMASKRIYA